MSDTMKKSGAGEAIKLFKSTDMLHRKCFEQVASERFGIHRSQHMVLMFISRNSDISQKDIAEEFKISAAAIAVTLKKLENAGLIMREVAEGDNRKNRINITEKGQSVINETHKLFSDIDYNMFDGLTNEEIEAFRRCLEKMQKNLYSMAKLVPEMVNGKD